MYRSRFEKIVKQKVAKTNGVGIWEVGPNTPLGPKHKEIELAVAEVVDARVGLFNSESKVKDVVESYAEHFKWH